MTFSVITTPRLVLRYLQPADLDAFLAYRSDPMVSRYQSWSDFTRQEAMDFIEDMGRSRPGTPGTWFQFAVARREDDHLIGDTALFTTIDGRQGEIGFTLARESWGQGYGFEATAAMLSFAFSVARLHRITGTADVANKRSIALLERLGFRREGHHIQSYFDAGEWRDEVMYALLAAEWKGA